ncbi:hypothetical protein DM860_015381 [Cuscuta australis]|uniref:Protein kinase domain-containing protein n=1 Tax=Cuscuta australis TaxID=267555 RepID=A0A328DP05_9ASTE|nr:hypothetical protein DM860_015381 [Cuscuta australis]
MVVCPKGPPPSCSVTEKIVGFVFSLLQSPVQVLSPWGTRGDLSIYTEQRNGRIPEPTAEHFMQHLASGLRVLCENNLIHQDIKPQELQPFCCQTQQI